MKKINFKKRILFSSVALGIVGSSIGVATSLTSINKDVALKNNETLNSVSSQNLNNVATQAFSIPTFSDLSAPRQNIAFNSTNSKFAVITSPTTQAAAATTNYDGVALYDSNNGSKIWEGNASNLVTPSSGTSQQTTGTIKAISFLQGSLGREELLMVLIEDNSSLKLSFVSTTNSNNTPTVKQTISLTNGSGSTNNGYQYFINVNNFLNLSIDICGIKNDSSSSISFKYLNLNSTSSNNSFNLININSTIYSSFFSTNSKINSFYFDENNYYFVFQQDKNNVQTVVEPQLENNNVVTLMKVKKNFNSTISIDSSNLMSLNLPTEYMTLLSSGFFLANAIGNNGVNHLVLSKKQATTQQEETSTTNDLVIVTYNTANFGSSNPFSIKKLTINNISSTISTILSISPLYDNVGAISGFISLTSDNKAIRFDVNFNSYEQYYDFSKLSGEQIKNGETIVNVYTKKNDATWYGQAATGTIYQFSGPNLIGKLESTQTERQEILASVGFIDEKNLSSSIIFQKAEDNETFKNFINNNALSFLEILNDDPVFGTPVILATVESIQNVSGSSNKYVNIKFEQQLRKINTSGSIVQTETKVLLGYQTYTFINDNIKVSVKAKSEIPQSITEKYPSQVTQEEVKQILNIENASNYTIGLQPNDSFGTLTVNITSPYAWVNGQLKVNYIETVNIGTANSPYFMIDILNGLSGTVEFATDEYLEKQPELKSSLSIKYGSTLPSDVSASDILNDFIILGDAFSDRQLINQGVIEAPSASNVQLIPVDTDGYLYVTLTIPKIGNKTNIVYSFKTASIFKQNATSSQNSYLFFKTNEEVLNVDIVIGTTTQKLSSYLPTKIAQQIQNDTKWLLYFVDMSYYVLNLIYDNSVDQSQKEASLEIQTNDGLGELTVGIRFKNKIPGLDSNVFSKTFTGFAKQGSAGAPQVLPTFSWKNLSSTQFSGMTASEVTVEQINKISSLLYEENATAKNLAKSISVTPLNASAAVMVTLTYKNWWEKQSINGQETNVLLQEKTFTTILTNGIRSSKQALNTIVWKSYDELDDNIKNSTADNAIQTINSSASTDLEKLQKLANLSDPLIAEINANPQNLALSITSNNAMGTIDAFARFTINGETQSFGTTISGFNLESANYVVVLASDTSEVAKELKQFIPSQLTDAQIGSLVQVQLGNNFSRRITSSYDDIKGTLTVKVELFETLSNNETVDVIPAVERTYTGFKTNIPEYKGTNYLIVSLSIIIPIVLLLSPILYIVLYKNRKDVKKFSKVLDKRLSEQMKKKKNVEVNSIKDLLSIDND